MDLNALAVSLAGELDAIAPIIDRQAQWPRLLLRQRTFIGAIAWPEALATSARVVVFRRRKVVVVRQRDGQLHVNPGGRLEAGERVEDAARREVLEETGWRLGPLTALGFHHFQPLGERPADFPHDWRDFVQPIFVAEGLAYDAAARDRAQLEAGSRLMNVRKAFAVLPPDQSALLEAALVSRGRSRPSSGRR